MNKKQRLIAVATAVCYFLEMEDTKECIKTIEEGHKLEISHTLKKDGARGPGLKFVAEFYPSGNLAFYDPVADTTLWEEEALEAIKKFILAFSTKRGDFSFEEETLLLEEKTKSLKEKTVGLLT